MRKLLILVALLILATPLVSALYVEEYTSPGTYYPVMASNTSSIYLSMCGAGSSGSSSGLAGYPLQTTWGHGGNKGECSNITYIAVVPGETYTIYVPSAGQTAAPDVVAHPEGVSNIGGDATAFGYTMHAGATVLAGDVTTRVGETGISSYFMTDRCVAASSNASSGGPLLGTYIGGLGGTGCGSGGGGAGNLAEFSPFWGASYGGAGGDGYIRWTDMNNSGVNIPNYTASPTSTGYGNSVTFTDLSIINDISNLVYDWDFGDATAHSSTRGTVTHVYATYGVFTTNLTITSDTGTVYLNKSNYITITNTPITAWYNQKLVPFKIVDAYGADLSGANVSVSYITNTLPSKDPAYLTSAFGISQAVANQMVNGDVAMQGLTGTNGQISFMMFPAIQYGITITNETAGLSKYVEIYPTDSDYIIRCPLTSQAMPTMASTSLTNASLYVTEPNSSWITWNLLYSDPSGHTTGLTWNVTCWNNMTVMHTNSWGAVGTSTVIVDNYTFPSLPVGEEYVAMYDAVRDIP